MTSLPRPPPRAHRAAGDTGIGNDNPGDYWTDFYGNRRAPSYLVDGVDCRDFEDEPCRLYSRARDVVAGLIDNGVDLVVHAGDLDYESAPKMWRHFVDETIIDQGVGYLAAKGNHDADGFDDVEQLWSGPFYTLVPIRPRSRGARRSSRTFLFLPACVSLRPSLAFDPRRPRLSTPTDAPLPELRPDVGSRGKLPSGPEGYAAILSDTVPAGASCEGKYGEAMACEYGGVTIVLSAVGVDQAGESANRDHYAFIDDALRKSASRWKICAWHMTMANMQVSYKGDSVGWGAYEICRKHGAFIVTGHAHTYSRTRELKRFGTKRWSHTSEDIQTNGPDDDVVHLRRVLLTLVPIRPRSRGERRSLRAFLPGVSLRPPLAFNPDTPRRLSTPPDAFQLHPDDAALYGTTLISPGENGTAGVAVVGIGGYKNEEQLKSAPHWSKVYSSKCLPNDDACEEAPEANKFGALMCDFDDLSENARAECWTVTTSGAFYTLVPIRPRWRCGRRSLRTLPVASLRPPPAFKTRPRRLSTPTDAYELQPDIRLYGTALREARDGAYEAKLVSVPGRQVLPRRGTAP
jgi:hypothetical protein